MRGIRGTRSVAAVASRSQSYLLKYFCFPTARLSKKGTCGPRHFLLREKLLTRTVARLLQPSADGLQSLEDESMWSYLVTGDLTFGGIFQVIRLQSTRASFGNGPCTEE